MGSIQETIAKNIIFMAKSMVPNGSVHEFKNLIVAKLEAKAAASRNPLDDKAVAVLKSEEADQLLTCVLECLVDAADAAAKSSETDIDDALVGVLRKFFGVEGHA